jgi:hypothetical protein
MIAKMFISEKLLETWNPEETEWPEGTKVTYIGPASIERDTHDGKFFEYLVEHPTLDVDIVTPWFKLEDGHVKFVSF